jgi:hypothetical protein
MQVKAIQDPRLIYLFVILSVLVPIVARYTIMPARLQAAEKMYQLVETTPQGLALVFLDYGPSTKAENVPQSEVLIEHLMRRRIPMAVFTQTPLGESFADSVPRQIAERLAKEFPGQRWRYGEDWVNLGFKPGGALFLQALAKSDDLVEFLGKDAAGTSVKQFKVFEGVRNLGDVKLVAEFTGLGGMFDRYIQFMQRKGYVPPLVHGCTSITIPESYIYLDSGQLKGLLEGLSGAAWYSQLLRNAYPDREPDEALVSNTALGISQLTILFLIALGNIVALKQRGAQ